MEKKIKRVAVKGHTCRSNISIAGPPPLLLEAISSLVLNISQG